MVAAQSDVRSKLEAAGIRVEDLTPEELESVGLKSTGPQSDPEQSADDPPASTGHPRASADVPRGTIEGKMVRSRISFGAQRWAEDVLGDIFGTVPNTAQAAIETGAEAVGALGQEMVEGYPTLERMGGIQGAGRFALQESGRGAVAAIASIPEAVAIAADKLDEARGTHGDVRERALFQYGEAMRSWYEQIAPRDPENPLTDSMLAEAANSFGMSMTILGLGAGAQLIGLSGPMASTLSGMAAEGAHAWREVYEDTGDEDKAWLAYMLQGGAGSLEALNLIPILRGAPVFKQVLLGTGLDVSTEMAQEMIANGVAKYVTEHDEAREIFDNVLRAGGLGLFTGMAVPITVGMARGAAKAVTPGKTTTGPVATTEDATAPTLQEAERPDLVSESEGDTVEPNVTPMETDDVVEPNVTPYREVEPDVVEPNVTPMEVDEETLTPLTEAEVQDVAKAEPDTRQSEPVSEVQPKAAIAKTDEWLADRQVDEAKADVQAAKNEEELDEIVGRRSVARTVGEAVKGTPKEAQREVDRAIHLNIDLRNAEERGFGTPEEQLARWGGELSEDQLAVYERSQNLSEEELALADKIIEQNRALGLRGYEEDVLSGFYENYTARLWKSEEDAQIPEGLARFTTKTGRSRARGYESILQGWANGRELNVEGAIGAQRLASKQIAQVIHDRNLIKTGKAMGFLSEAQNDDWVAIEHPNFQKWIHVGNAYTEGRTPVQVDTYKSGLFTDPDGNIYMRVPLYAPKRLGKDLNAILGKSKLNEIPGVETITKYNALLKAQVLFTSLFHHQAFLRSFMFGTPLEYSLSHASRPIKSYREGRRAIENFTPEVEELVRGGLTIGTLQDFDELAAKEKTAIGNAIDKVPMAREIKNGLVALRDQQINYLFHRLGPNLKVMAGLLEYRHQLRKNRKKLESGAITKEEIASLAADVANDDFGGLNLQKMRRNPTTQHAARLLLLAPDWTESNVRSMVKAFKTGSEGKVYRALWGRVLLRAGGATVLWNAIMAGFDDEEDFWSMYQKAWDQGGLRWTSMDITPIYRGLGGDSEKRKWFSFLGHFRDPIKFIIHPAQSAKHKSSILAGAVLEALEGTDWKGQTFTTFDELLGIDDKGLYKTTRKGKYEKGDPKGGKLAGQTVAWKFGGGAIDPEQVPSFLLNQARGLTPIQVQNLIAWLYGEIDGFDAMSKSLGLTTQTSYPKQDDD